MTTDLESTFDSRAEEIGQAAHDQFVHFKSFTSACYGHICIFARAVKPVGIFSLSLTNRF